MSATSRTYIREAIFVKIKKGKGMEIHRLFFFVKGPLKYDPPKPTWKKKNLQRTHSPSHNEGTQRVNNDNWNPFVRGSRSVIPRQWPSSLTIEREKKNLYTILPCLNYWKRRPSENPECMACDGGIPFRVPISHIWDSCKYQTFLRRSSPFSEKTIRSVLNICS